MMKFLLLLVPALTFAESHRPMSEMHGGCDHYAMNLRAELAAWAEPGADAAALGTRKKVTLGLSAQKTKAVPAGKKKRYEGKFGGEARFRAEAGGVFRLSLGAKVWADVLDGDKALEADTFEMQTKCEKIFKAMEFRLEKGKSYVVRVAGAAEPKVELLLAPVATSSP